LSGQFTCIDLRCFLRESSIVLLRSLLCFCLLWLLLIDKVRVEAKLLVLGSAQWFVDVFLLLFELSSGLGGLLDSLVRIIDGFMLAESSSFPEES